MNTMMWDWMIYSKYDSSVLSTGCMSEFVATVWFGASFALWICY